LGSGDGIGSAKEAYFHSRILTRRRFGCAPSAKGREIRPSVWGSARVCRV
jgi:hypothetical protein